MLSKEREKLGSPGIYVNSKNSAKVGLTPNALGGHLNHVGGLFSHPWLIRVLGPGQEIAKEKTGSTSLETWQCGSPLSRSVLWEPLRSERASKLERG